MRGDNDETKRFKLEMTELCANYNLEEFFQIIFPPVFLAYASWLLFAYSKSPQPYNNPGLLLTVVFLPLLQV